MSRWAGAPLGGYLPADIVLGQIEAAVLVTDRRGNLLYANPYAGKLFGVPGDGAHLAGRSLLSIGFGEGPGRAAELTRQVLRGRAWNGTVAVARPDGAQVFARVQAVPLRHPSGAIDGIVIIVRQASRRSSQRERDRIVLLDRIGERLARSLELDATLRHVAQTLIPQFADHCFIDLFAGDKLIRRAQVNAGGWSPPAGGWAQVGEQIAYPEGHFCQQAMARREPVVVESLADEQFPAPHQQSLKASEDVGMVSIVAAPLIARGQLLGVMSLALSRLTEREDQHYEADDRDFLGAIASRVAVAIDNSMLFEEERRTALAFQTSLLPQDLPSFDGLEVAWRYVPAKPLETHGQGIQTQVGGDWYDLIPLSAGRVGIVIGDVEGRGARAAAVMGQLRAALRAFAQDDKPPPEILRKLDDWCRSLGGPSDSPAALDPPTVSCTYLVYDAWSRTLSFANAGHDAPLLITDGEVGTLEIEHKGLLLGVRGPGLAGVPTYREEVRQLPPGATLVLFTDGLTDRRQRADGNGHYTEDESAQMLRSAVRAVAGSGVEAIARAAEEAVPGEIDDDMAIVVVRTSRTELDSWERSFPAEAIRVSQARRQAQAVLAGWGVPTGQAELACLLVSEVVTNVVLHTAGPSRGRTALTLETAGAGVGGRSLTAGWQEAPPRREAAMPGLVALPGLDAGQEAVAGRDAVRVPGLDADREAVPGRQVLTGDGYLEPGGKRFTLRLRRGAAAVWVEVFDTDLRLPRIRSANETDEGGRGLYLVDQLASRWGSRPTREGKAVWFEIPVSPASGS